MNIDTIVLKYYTEIAQESLAFWDRSDEKKANGARYLVYRLNETLENDAVIKCTCRVHTWVKRPLLLVDFSLPMVLYGNNYTTICELDLAVASINRTLAKINGLPVITVETGIVHRVDIYHDYQVGELVPYYVKALQHLEYPYRKTGPWTSEGVQFLNKQRCTKFYNKEKESGDPINHGILRQETTFRKEGVKKFTGKKLPHIFDLAPNLLKAGLEDDLQDLGLLGKSIGTSDTTLQNLCEQYGEMAGVYYYGLLHAKVNLTEDIILASMHSHPRSLDRRLKKIVEAGIPLTLTEYRSPLPPLVIQG